MRDGNTDATLLDEGALGLAGWTGQSRGMTAAHRHLDLEINYVLSGPMRYLVGGRMVSLPPRRLCLLWGGVPHQMLRSRETTEAIWLTIPLTTVLRWGLPDPMIRPLLATGILQDAAPRAGDEALLHQWLGDLPGRDRRVVPGVHTDAVVRIVLLEIEARLRRFAVGLQQPSRTDTARDIETVQEANAHGDVSAHGEKGLAAVEAMAQFISGSFREEIGVTEIAQAAFLHPNYAMTLFRRHTGMTLAQYLTVQRVAHAQRLLATTGDPIGEIAIWSGFGSVSRFYEAFRQQTGQSPRRFRLQMAPAPAPPKE